MEILGPIFAAQTLSDLEIRFACSFEAEKAFLTKMKLQNSNRFSLQKCVCVYSTFSVAAQQK